MRALTILILTIGAFAAPALAETPTPAGEKPVDPYVQGDANAGAQPFKGDEMWKAFHEEAGVKRVVNGLIDRAVVDPKIEDIFKGQDIVRLRRTLNEQFCYLLDGPCRYTGKDMKAAHKDMGLQMSDFNRLVELLQASMDKEGVSFRAQNRFLAKLAPMERVAVEK